MPELPEIETLVRDLRRTVVGKTVVEAHAGQPKALNVPLLEFRERVRGVIAGVDRHGKSAVLRLPEGSLWLHLGLGGTVQFLPAAPWPAAKFLSLRLAEGGQLAVDKVFMGHAYFVPAGRRPPGEELGIDALDPALTARRFAELLRRKPKAAIKAALMDQALLAGVGNTYADEILLKAGIHPARRAGTLTDEEIAVLHSALGVVLQWAIAEGGEAGWHDLEGRPGHYQPTIHGAERCGRCGRPVETIAIGGRTGYFCPACQPVGAGQG